MNRKSIIFFILIISFFIGTYFLGFYNLKNVENEFFEKIPKEVEQITNKSLIFIEKGEAENLVQLFLAEYRKKSNAIAEMRSISGKIASYGNHTSKKLIGYTLDIINGVEYHTVTYELEYDGFWLTYRTISSIENDKYKLYRLDFSNPRDTSLSELNKFTLRKRTIFHYIVLLLHILITIFTMITCSVCFGSNKPKRILWTILILFGIALFRFNWSNGAFDYQIFNIGIPTTAISKTGSVSPIVLKIRVPLMAILYWIKRNKEKVEYRDD